MTNSESWIKTATSSGDLLVININSVAAFYETAAGLTKIRFTDGGWETVIMSFEAFRKKVAGAVRREQ